MLAAGDIAMAAKLAELDINTDNSPKPSSSSGPSFSPLNSTSATVNDDPMSDEKPTETDTEAMITMGLPTNFSSTPRFNRKQPARKPGKKVKFGRYWASFSDLFVNLVKIAQKTNSATAVDEVLQPAVILRRSRLIEKHRSADRFLELATGFSNQTIFPNLYEYVKHYIDFDVRESNVIRALTAAKSVVAKLHYGPFSRDFQL